MGNQCHGGRGAARPVAASGPLMDK